MTARGFRRLFKPLSVGWLTGAVAALLLGFSPGARADVWGFVDEKGVAHFASEPLDQRYQLFYRAEPSVDARFDARTGLAAPPPIPGTQPDAPSLAPPPSLPGVGKSVDKLNAFFLISPGYKRVQHLVRDAASAYGVDVELLKALIVTESGFDEQAVSPKGAVGLMQLMPATAQRYGVVGDKQTPLAKRLTNAQINIQAGTRYLADLLQLFGGKLDLALAAYNAGEGAVQRAGNRIPDYKETQNYVKTVLGLYQMLKPPTLARASLEPQPGQTRVLSSAQMTVPVGGAAGRGNMVPTLSAQGVAPVLPPLPVPVADQ